MNKPFGTIASVGITFFVTLLLNTILNYYTADRGTIGVSRPIEIDGKLLTVVTVENYSKEFLEGVALELPVGVSPQRIFADSPVSIVEAPLTHKGTSQLVKIGQISPKLITRIFIPTPLEASASPVRVLNSEASGVSLRHDDELESPLRRALISALVIASLYSVFSFLTIRYAQRLIGVTEEKIDAMEGKIELLSARSNQAENRIAKQRLLLLARLFDYSKELGYWRNTLKVLLLNAGADKRTVDSIIQTITKTLGTHGTQEPAETFETIRIAAGWLAEAEKETAITCPISQSPMSE